MTARFPVVPSDWREVLRDEDRRALAEQGFLHIRAAADQRQLRAMRETWEVRMQAPEEPAFLETRGNNEGPGGLEEQEAFRHCLEHRYVMSAVAEVLDGDVALLGFRGRNPRRDSGQQGFHTDSGRPVKADRQLLVNAFWMLDDMDASNGATRVIPGTHRLGRLPAKGLSGREAQHPEARSIEARAGDVLVFSAHLWHAGSKNPSGAPRRIAMAHFGRREMVESYVYGRA